jgi:hypothetical protein
MIIDHWIDHSHLPTCEDGTDRVFRNVGFLYSDAGEIPRGKYTISTTRRKFENYENLVFNSSIHYVPIPVAARSKAWVCGRSLARILGSNPTGGWMSVCCECCVRSGRGPCVGLITRPEESYRLWCVWVWSWSLDNGALAHWGAAAPWKVFMNKN